jgi:hypothetical protein
VKENKLIVFAASDKILISIGSRATACQLPLQLASVPLLLIAFKYAPQGFSRTAEKLIGEKSPVSETDGYTHTEREREREREREICDVWGGGGRAEQETKERGLLKERQWWSRR